jgi:hypothetical protein
LKTEGLGREEGRKRRREGKEEEGVLLNFPCP